MSDVVLIVVKMHSHIEKLYCNIRYITPSIIFGLQPLAVTIFCSLLI